MKFTDLQKSILFESAKKILAEANPYDNNEDMSWEDENPKDNENETEDFGSAYSPDELKEIVKKNFVLYKQLLTTTYWFVEAANKIIAHYINGQMTFHDVYVELDNLMNKQFQGKRMNLNKIAYNFEFYMKKLSQSIPKIGNAEYKYLFNEFWIFFNKALYEYKDMSDSYYRYYNYLKDLVIMKDLKLTKEQISKYHTLSWDLRTNIKDTKILNTAYYKTIFNTNGTNKGFFDKMRDYADNKRNNPQDRSKPKNPYDGQKPTNAPQLDYKGSNEMLDTLKFHSIENELLRKIQELTKKYIASNFKDKSISQEIDKIEAEMNENRKEYFANDADRKKKDKKYYSNNNSPELKQRFEDTDKKYQGWGAWNEFNPKNPNSKTPKTIIPKGDKYRSRDTKENEPGFRQRHWDPDLQDYQRDNNRDLNDYGRDND